MLLNAVRILAGLSCTAGLVVLAAIVLLRSAFALVKEGAGVLVYLVALFTSGFTKGTSPQPEAALTWLGVLPQAGLFLTLLSMLVSVFFPAERTVLHCVAGAGAVALLWIFTGQLRAEVLCAPMLGVWFVYYAICVWRVR